MSPGIAIKRWLAVAALASFAAFAQTKIDLPTQVKGVLPVVNGGAGAVSGALKANGAGTVSQAACADLSNGATGCSTATGTAGATIPLLNGNNTFSGTDTFSNPIVGSVTGSAATASTATTVITNANLTGPITSTGNATAIGSQTGTGSTFVMSVTPTISSPTLNTATLNTPTVNLTGLLKGNGASAVTAASAGSDYVAPSTTVNGHALSANVTVTASDIGLGSVTNDVQTKAAVVPNTAPSAGQVLAGNAGGTAYAPVTVSGDCTLSSAGAATCTKTNGSVFVASATTDTTNAANISSGALPAGRMPALTGDVTTSVGAVATTITAGVVTESKITLADVTTLNVSTTKHGFAPKAPNDSTKYLDGTGAYSVPAGSGGISSGTFASKPGSPTTGQLYLATDVGDAPGTLLTYSGTRWKPINGRARLKTLGAIVGSIANAEQLVVQATLPAALLQANDAFEVYQFVSKSGATDNITLRIRWGTAGTTSDTALLNVSSTATARTVGGLVSGFKITSATAVQNYASPLVNYSGGFNVNTLPAQTSGLANVSNALFISIGLLSSGATDTLQIQQGYIDWITP